MDVQTYAVVGEVCRLLAGRLSDDALGTVREDYAAGELDLADGKLLLNLAYQSVGITTEERDLIRSFLGDPDDPDLLDVPVIAEVPPPPYRFSPIGPATAPDPTPVDVLLAAEAPQRRAHHLHRVWRTPLDGAPDEAAWLYVLQVPEGVDELSTHSGLMAQLWISLGNKGPLEVLADGAPRTPYQVAALAAAHLVWSA
ncbi:hypothetical protein [Micromonospora vulcania]|uniref:Uncharacterized protein n=1 Tax=Micromonospora vulcania TaxID=1441873 RepID=A0ABW1H529_9ACTN